MNFRITSTSDSDDTFTVFGACPSLTKVIIALEILDSELPVDSLLFFNSKAAAGLGESLGFCARFSDKLFGSELEDIPEQDNDVTLHQISNSLAQNRDERFI